MNQILENGLKIFYRKCCEIKIWNFGHSNTAVAFSTYLMCNCLILAGDMPSEQILMATSKHKPEW